MTSVTQFYVDYNMNQMQHKRPQSQLWPVTGATRFVTPNTTPAGYPMQVPKSDIINSTSGIADPAAIYSGIEPLAALDRKQLENHFQDTSVPAIASVVNHDQCMNCRRMLPVQGRQSDAAHRQLLKKMVASAEFYRRVTPQP